MWTLPTPVAMGLAGAAGAVLLRLGTETEIGAETMRMLARSGGCSIEKARALLDCEPRVDLGEGMRRTEGWLAREGLLGDERRRQEEGDG